MSLLITTKMKGGNEIFCQPTIASIFDREPRGPQAGDHCFQAFVEIL